MGHWSLSWRDSFLFLGAVTCPVWIRPERNSSRSHTGSYRIDAVKSRRAKPWQCLESWAPLPAGGPETKTSGVKAHQSVTFPNLQRRSNHCFEQFYKYTRKTTEIPNCSSTVSKTAEVVTRAGRVSQINSNERFQRASVPEEHTVLLCTNTQEPKR